MRDATDHHHEDPDDAKRVALGLVSQAFADAQREGLDSDFVVQAALFEAFRHLVDLYGEEQTAIYAATFPDRIRGGSFSVAPRH